MRKITIALVLLLGLATIVTAGPPVPPPAPFAINAEVTTGTSTTTKVSPATLAYKLLSYMAVGGNETQFRRFFDAYLAYDNCSLTSDGNFTCTGKITGGKLSFDGGNITSTGAGGLSVKSVTASDNMTADAYLITRQSGIAIS